MKRIIKHVALPALGPLAIVALYLTPVALFGCVARGLMALAVVVISTAAAFVTVRAAFRARRAGDALADWWLLSTVIHVLPGALIVGPLG